MALKISVAVVMLATACLGDATPAVATQGHPTGESGTQGSRVSVLVLPRGVRPEALSAVEGAAVGLMNPGLGEVSPAQTWLDVSQGARVFDGRYDTPLNTMSIMSPFVRGWGNTVERASSAQADIRPGLLATVLRRNGLVPAVAGSGYESRPSTLAVVSRDGRLTLAGKGCPGPRCHSPLTISTAGLTEAAALSRERERGELLIVIESPPAESGDQLTIAVAGPGFHGMLDSDSTRTRGYVLSTDLAPTILRHLGLGIPDAMTGLPIESAGEVDFAALAELEGRYRQVGKRKGTAMLFPLLAWSLLAGGLVLGGRGRLARPVVSTLCLAVILLPATLLLTASLSPSTAVEAAIAGLLPVLASVLLLRLAPGWRALAVACALTVAVYAVDLVAGLALTPKAVIGPNPGLGARFYGIGNELESTLMVLTSVGTGAAVQAWGRALSPSRAALCFLLAGLAGTVVFASGRFGADVGAAIIFPVAAVAAAAVLFGRPRLIWLGAVAALFSLILLALLDTLTGSETHFVRSLFEGGPSDSAFDVIAHRLGATVDSFTRLSRLPVTLLSLALILFAWFERAWIARLLQGLDPLRAGMTGAVIGSLAGTLTNDSGALFIHVGVLYTGLVIAFIWASRPVRTEP